MPYGNARGTISTAMAGGLDMPCRICDMLSQSPRLEVAPTSPAVIFANFENRVFHHGTTTRAVCRILLEGLRDYTWIEGILAVKEHGERKIVRRLYGGSYGSGTYITRAWIDHASKDLRENSGSNKRTNLRRDS
jgi:hypothetical protein